MAARKQKPKITAKRKPGRPSGTADLTDDVIKNISELILAGNFAEVAAAAQGIYRQKFSQWLVHGHQDRLKGIESQYRKLLETVEEADAKAEADALESVKTLAKHEQRPDAKVALEMMGRRWSARWNQVQQVKVQVEREVERVLDIVEQEAPPDVAERILKRLVALSATEGGSAETSKAPGRKGRAAELN